jgi:hypothetical protein
MTNEKGNVLISIADSTIAFTTPILPMMAGATIAMANWQLYKIAIKVLPNVPNPAYS